VETSAFFYQEARYDQEAFHLDTGRKLDYIGVEEKNAGAADAENREIGLKPCGPATVIGRRFCPVRLDLAGEYCEPLGDVPWEGKLAQSREPGDLPALRGTGTFEGR
jgi:hypothetical protein